MSLRRLKLSIYEVVTPREEEESKHIELAAHKVVGILTRQQARRSGIRISAGAREFYLRRNV
jgi:hypothetical protein